jgi:heptosyltransferase-2
MKILVWALSGIGDALMFTPALQFLKDNVNDAIVDVVVMFKGSYELFANNPLVNKVIYFDFLHEGKLKSLLFIKNFVRQYDVSINVYPSNRREYNLINFLTFSPVRASIDHKRQGNKNFGFLNNVRVLEDDKLHNVEENIRLVAKIFNLQPNYDYDLSFFTDEKSKDIARQFIKDNPTDGIRIGFHPGCNTLKNHEKRRWETAKFADLAKKLINKYNAQILVFGGPEESHLKNKIVESVNSEKCISVDGKTLSETFEIIKYCKYFVTNDSSLMHLASAGKRFVFPIIGPTNLNYIHPWRTKYKAINLNLSCSPCFYYSPKPLTCSRNDIEFECIKDISADYAFQIISEEIDKEV